MRVAAGRRGLLAELAHLYERPSEPLPSLRYRYAQYLAERATEPPREDDVHWWRQRLGELPGAPELPWRPPAEVLDPQRVIRLHRWLSPAQRASLGEQARRHAVTATVAVATAFAEVLGAWSAEPRFMLNVPTFDRRPLHPEVDSIVGDFTSSILLDIDLRARMPFAERARTVLCSGEARRPAAQSQAAQSTLGPPSPASEDVLHN
ncbi:MAG TPA: condensation domain-containing protein [Solirubrobacteraceae bacterium]